MPSRVLDFPVFDADNHMYETTDAFTKYLPAEYDGLIKFVNVDGRSRIAVKNRISDYIPNPTFEVVAAPGAQEEYFKHGNPEGRSRRDVIGKGIPALPGFQHPEQRVELMNALGIQRALMWPTLASLLEERMRDDPDAAQAVVHALNQWMSEHWTFNYEGRIFPVPVVNLGSVKGALRELEFVVSRGARIILIRPAPVWTWKGPRSPALPEFDDFWRSVDEAGVLIGMHASDSGYQRYYNEWEGIAAGEMLPFKGGSGFQAIVGHHGRPITDAIASIIGHGLCTRFPGLTFLPIENGTQWVKSLLDSMQYAWYLSPNLFDENPVEAFRRSIYVHPFHEEDPRGVIDLLGTDRVLFGSDYPHPEGMSDPITFVDEIAFLPKEDQAKIMGGNLARLMKVA